MARKKDPIVRALDAVLRKLAGLPDADQLQVLAMALRIVERAGGSMPPAPRRRKAEMPLQAAAARVCAALAPRRSDDP